MDNLGTFKSHDLLYNNLWTIVPFTNFILKRIIQIVSGQISLSVGGRDGVGSLTVLRVKLVIMAEQLVLCPWHPVTIISRLSCVRMIQVNFDPPGSDQIDSLELNIRQKGIFKCCSSAQPLKMV